MKTLLIFILAMLLTGCISQKAVQDLIDEKIASNNNVFIQPALAQQAADIAAVTVKADKNSLAILESSSLVSVHQDVLLGLFQKQQETAAFALDQLTPKPAAVPQIPTPAPSPITAPVPESKPVPEAVTPE